MGDDCRRIRVLEAVVLRQESDIVWLKEQVKLLFKAINNKEKQHAKSNIYNRRI